MVESLQELADLQARANCLSRGIPSTITTQDATFMFVGAISSNGKFFRTDFLLKHNNRIREFDNDTLFSATLSSNRKTAAQSSKGPWDCFSGESPFLPADFLPVGLKYKPVVVFYSKLRPDYDLTSQRRADTAPVVTFGNEQPLPKSEPKLDGVVGAVSKTSDLQSSLRPANRPCPDIAGSDSEESDSFDEDLLAALTDETPQEQKCVTPLFASSAPTAQRKAVFDHDIFMTDCDKDLLMAEFATPPEIVIIHSDTASDTPQEEVFFSACPECTLRLDLASASAVYSETGWFTDKVCTLTAYRFSLVGPCSTELCSNCVTDH
jgi:hypothetical protein